MKLRAIILTSLFVFKATADEAATEAALTAASDSDATVNSDNAVNSNPAVVDNVGEEKQRAEAIDEDKEEEHHDDSYHDLTEAFEIIDENEDGMLQEDEIITAIRKSEHHIEITPEQYVDNLMPKTLAGADENETKAFDLGIFTAMIQLASAEEIKEGEMPSYNQQLSQLASDVIYSYYHFEEEPYDPSTEEWFNPHNMTYDELEYHLYEWEEDAVGHVNEYLDWQVFERMRNQQDDWYNEDEDLEDEDEEEETKPTSIKDQKRHDDGSKTKVEMRKSDTNHYLKLSNDVAHVVEFYSPYCPHCQHFKWEYIEIATETKRRTTTTPVEFHAVSCEIYWRICSTYNIDGFPTVIGWKKGESMEEAGIVMNEEEEIYPDLVGEMLELDLAHEAVDVYEWEFETEEEKLEYEKKQAKKAKKAAQIKTSWHQYSPHTHNDRYHNAALSLAFAIKTQLFQTLTEDGKMELKSKNALIDFLNLMEWASPSSWDLRTGFVKELQWSLDSDIIRSRGSVESIIDSDMDRHRSGKQDLLWGYVDQNLRTSWAGGLLGHSHATLAKDDKKWTNSCTHSEPGKGFTCGLWNLFHILTIGSSKPEHKIYGFHRGYFVSPHHVADTIRNFVEYFFSCSVCRTHFLDMYDNCGHDHCTRLKSEINVDTKDGSSKELAMWLWEVHNDVNSRLMKEAAQRQNRNVTQEETLASMFPTQKMCPDCWLDENMTTWDNDTVFKFLDDWYWPTGLPPSSQFRAVISGQSDKEMDIDITDEPLLSTTPRKSPLMMHLVAISCVVVCLLLAVSATRKRRERRKKFIDSRFVKKKKGFC